MKLGCLSSLKKSKAQTLVLFVQQVTSTKSTKKEETKIQIQVNNISSPLKKLVESLTDDKKLENPMTGKHGESVFLKGTKFETFKNILFVGLGDTSKIEGESFRTLGGTLESLFCANHIKTAAINLDSFANFPNGEQVQALVEGMLLASYRFDELKSKKESSKDSSSNKKQEKDEKELSIEIYSKELTKDLEKSVKTAEALASCVNFSRRLGDMPGNLMTPTILANEVQKSGKEVGLKVTVWDKARIEKEKMGGLLGVSHGSEEEPRFIIMEYHGAKNNQKPIAFVGKGLTFDSGGISLKPGAAMEEMKYDMCGGANVIGTMLAIAKLKLKINVIGLVPSTENMPSGKATKPGDIHTARNGKTFEVNNTDAEGRLILADALCYASEQKPQIIIDAATLTGAIVVALGNTHTGFFTRNSDLKKQIDQAALNSGELVWQMPLCDYHAKDIKGTYADLSNISHFKGAGSATAAAFLEHFVDKEIPWAHFDIAGTAWAVGNRHNYCPKKGASGVMVRTFVELAKQFEQV